MESGLVCSEIGWGGIMEEVEMVKRGGCSVRLGGGRWHSIVVRFKVYY